MKKLLYIPLIALLISCAGTKIPVKTGDATITLTDSVFCISKPLTATINQDSLFLLFQDGFTLTQGTNSIKISWQAGTTDPLNGQVVIEPNICVSNTDFCIKGQYFVAVHQTAFLVTLQRGITFGTPQASIFIQYSNGALTATPKVCIPLKK